LADEDEQHTESETTTAQEDLNSSTASDDPTTESPCKETESVDVGQKQKADALWADFLKDVGSIPKKSQPSSAVSTNLLLASSALRRFH